MTSPKRKPTFVVVIPRFEDIWHSYFAGEIIKGVSLAASRLHSDFLVHITDRSDHASWLTPPLMDRRFFDGIIFADIDNDLEIVKKAIRRGMSCMVLNNMLEEPMNWIGVNNKKAAREVIEYLIDLGHREIATVAGDISTQAGLYRLEGYREALLTRKITTPRGYIKFGNFLRTPARIAAQKLLQLKNRPTAIFAASDVMAMEVINTAKEFRLKVPEDLSVVGFDDNPINVTSSVELSTVSQPLLEMGRRGAEYLYLISRGKARLPVKEVLPTVFLPRKSTAAPHK